MTIKMCFVVQWDDLYPEGEVYYGKKYSGYEKNDG